MELRICHLYPDLLNLYGDRGNLAALRHRAEGRGVRVSIHEVPLGTRASLADYDCLFLGGGQDADQLMLQEELLAFRAAEMKAAVEDDVPLLAICGGYQILGNYYEARDGSIVPFAEIIDFHTLSSTTRMTGDLLFTWEELGATEEPQQIVAFENHTGKTYLGDGVAPFGRVLMGYGNNGEDQTEGVRYKNVFGTYGHGPLLPKNPQLTDHLLRLSLERKYGAVDFAPLDARLETVAHDYMVARLTKK